MTNRLWLVGSAVSVALLCLLCAPATTTAGTNGEVDTASEPSPPMPDQVTVQPGVFVLPLTGEFGTDIRHQEIEAIGREADKWGPGQLIVLVIDSPSEDGDQLWWHDEAERVRNAIIEVRQRHRLIAWIKRANARAAVIPGHCDEIYFTTGGTWGALGAPDMPDEVQRRLAELATSEWLHPAVVAAMIDDSMELSRSGRTWRNDLTGDRVYSRPGETLVLHSSTAVLTFLADGVADTEAELAKRLALPAWHEKSDFGRRIAASWRKTCATAEQDIPRLLVRLQWSQHRNFEAMLTRIIDVTRRMLEWRQRCPNVCDKLGVPDACFLERIIEERQYQLDKYRRDC